MYIYIFTQIKYTTCATAYIYTQMNDHITAGVHSPWQLMQVCIQTHVRVPCPISTPIYVHTSMYSATDVTHV